VDSHILKINRRHAKKFSGTFAEQDDTDRGYEDFKELAKDVEGVADVLWVSGTRMYLDIRIAVFECAA
jgi:delta-aminolevulinic acid dehydratase/porphobilinogen synthase